MGSASVVLLVSVLLLLVVVVSSSSRGGMMKVRVWLPQPMHSLHSVQLPLQRLPVDRDGSQRGQQTTESDKQVAGAV